MTGDRERDGDERAEPRVPDPLRARVETLFEAYRGYEPKSFQEALSAVCDLAAARIDDPGEGAGPDRIGPRGREHSAPTGVEADPIGSVEPILETGNADAVVRELAAEVLDEMTADAFDELEHGVDEGTGEGVADGMGTRAARPPADAPDPDGDGVPDSLSADPESDCALCGRSYRVSVLETTILADDGSVALVCPNCEG